MRNILNTHKNLLAALVLLATFIGIVAIANFGKNQRLTYRPKATGGPTVTASFCPAGGLCPVSFAKNAEFNVPFALAASTPNKISGTELFFTYDPAVLTYLSNTSDLLEVSVVDAQRDYNGKKLIHIVAVSKKRNTELPQTVNFTLKFKGLADGVAKISFMTGPSKVVGPIEGYVYTINPQNSIAVSPNPEQIVTSTLTVGQGGGANPTGVAPTPTGGNNAPGEGVTLNYKVRFAGVNATPVPTTKTTALKIRVAGGSLTEQKEYTSTATWQTDGTWSGSVVLTGITTTTTALGKGYSLSIKGPLHLAKRFCTLTATASGTPCANSQIYFTQATTTVNYNGEGDLLYGGDLPTQDGALTVVDVQKLISNLGKNEPSADINFDGIVNGADWELMLRSMQNRYDDAVIQ